MAQLRSLATVSGFTAISRVLGFLRDVLIARFIGANMVSDAFFTAFQFPNMFRRIFGEGAFNAAFVPLFAKKLDGDGKRRALIFGSHIFSLLAWVLGIGTVIAIPCMGWIMSVVAPGFKATHDSGWLEAEGGGAETRLAVEGAVTVEGLKAVFLRSSWESAAPTGRSLRIETAELVDREGHRVPLSSRPVEVLGEGRFQVVEGTGGLGLAGDTILKFSLPRPHPYETLEWKGAWEPGNEPGRGRLEIFRNHPRTFSLTVTLARITFIYLLCMALTAHLSGVLNTVRIFGMPAAVPIILNVVFLAGLVVFVAALGFAGGHVLAWCVFVAGFLQLAALWWACERAGYPIRLTVPRWSPEMRRLLLLMGPGILSAGIQQINLLIGRVLASHQETAVSYLYYSERVYQLPLGMVGIAFGVVLLPDITRKLRAKKDAEAQDSLNRGIEYALLITLPAAIALLVIAYPIISGIFEWGPNFTASKSRLTATALSAFALGLPGYVLVKVLQPGYFAREDTKTPMYIAGVTVLTNIVFSLILFQWLKSKGIGHVGIALSTSIAAWVNVALLAIGLHRRNFLRMDRRLRDRLWRIGICSSMMGILLLLLYRSMESFLLSGRWQCVVSLAILIVVGLASYGASALTLGATTPQELRQGFRRK